MPLPMFAQSCRATPDKTRAMMRFVKYVVTYPKITIILCLLVTAVLTIPLPHITLDGHFQGVFPPNFPAKQAINNLEKVFGGSEIVFLGIVSDNIYAPSILQKIQRLTKEIDKLDETDHVFSLFTIKNFLNTPAGIKTRNLLETCHDIERNGQALQDQIKANPIIRKYFLSADGTMTAIIATITPGANDKVVSQKFQDIQARETQIAQREEGGGIRSQGRVPSSSAVRFYLGGMPIIRATLANDIQRENFKFLGVGLGVMMLIMGLCLRSVRGVLLPLTVVLMSSLCPLGLMVWLQKPIARTGIKLPIVLIAITTSYSIQVLVGYYDAVKAHRAAGQLPGDPRPDIVRLVLTRLSIPMLLVVVITMAGLLVLLAHPLSSEQDLGLFGSFGVLMAMFFSLTFIPAWLVILPISNVDGSNQVHTYWKIMLSKILSACTQRPLLPGLVIIAAFFSACACLPGMFRLAPHLDFLTDYPPDHPLVESTRLFNEKLGGMTTLDVVIEGDLTNPDNLKQIQTMQAYLDHLPTIGKTLSIVDILKHQVSHQDDPMYFTLPETRALLASDLSFYTMSGKSNGINYLISRDYRQGHVIGLMPGTDITQMAKTVRQVETFVANTFHDVNTIRLTSVTSASVLAQELVRFIVQGQRQSVFLALAVIFVMTTLIFRSLVVGVWSVLPLAIVMVSVFGVIGYQGITMSTAPTVFLSIFIGNGVNYAIQIICQVCHERRQAHRTPVEALEVTLNRLSQSMLTHVLPVTIGFAMFLGADFPSVFAFGCFLTLTMLTGFLGTCILLPATILVLKPKFLPRVEICG
jgi:predicted RND superfamily exporter protein